ncbi:MAG: OmpH family outer membrane protein [Bacteroidota bacterium]
MKKLLFAALLLCLTTAIQAQRYGHLNFSGLLAIMPESAEAEAQLQVLNDELVAEGEALAAQLQTGIEAYQAAEASQEKSPLQLQEMVQALQAQQQALAAFEQNAAQQLEEKRMELLEPVVDQAQAVINEIAQENGFQLVFDTGVFNAILFAQESEDLMPLVKAKMGLE